MSDTTRAVSSGARSSTTGRVVGFLFFSVFFAAGSAFGFFAFGIPLRQMFAARQWQSTSCEIVSSSVYTSRSSDGSTYRVDVTYRYFVDDRSHSSDRYQFMNWTSSGYDGKAAIVERLRPGTLTDCWVNPANPDQAVIERGPTFELWFGLLPLVFIVVGGVGMVACVMRGPLSGTSTTTGATYTKAVPGAESATLRPRHRRGAKLAGFIAVALFWNGILLLFLNDILSVARRESFPWFLALFLVPFVVVGVGLVVLAVRQALQLSNPRPIVTVNKPIVALGDELRVDWSMKGRVGKLSRFSIALEAREEATYMRGTDRKTDTNIFATIPLANQTPPQIAGAGSASVKIPADTMHSFDATYNKIVWVVRVRGEVPSWPDSDDEFPFTVGPRGR